MTAVPLSYAPCFIPGKRGRLFALQLEPKARPEGCRGVLFIPAFAEEMNKSRHMFFQSARELAQQGCVALLFDLYGTGDSEGDFADATWDGWVADIATAYAYLREAGVDEVNVVAERAGALLAADAICRHAIEVKRLILWQPVAAGDLFVNQFYRLRLAAELASDNKGASQRIKQELQELGVSEIAGYTVARDLMEPLAERRLIALSECFKGELHWCEVAADPERQPLPVTQRVVEQFKAAGCDVILHKAVGAPFWTTVEIEDVPDLWRITREVVCGAE